VKAAALERLRSRDERVRAMLADTIRAADEGEQVGDALRIILAQLDGQP
jgi:hypothetical protein